MWEEDDIEDDLEENVPVKSAKESSSSLVLWVVHFIALLQRKHYIPDSAISLLLQFLSILFKIMGPFHRGLFHCSHSSLVLCINSTKY